MKTPLLALIIGFTALPGIAREWTNASGKKIQADFVEVKGVEGSKVVVLKMNGGKTYDVALDQLSPADQTFVKDQAKAATAAAPAPAAKPEAAATKSIFGDMLKGKLVAVNGKKVGKYEMAAEPKFYAFYFSASWCGPCQAFTPKLVEFYNTSEGKKKEFEVIFVSRDNDENAMEEYMTKDKMPWPAISFRHLERLKKVQEFSGNGIPCLVLVDAEGNVVSDSYEGTKYVGPYKVMDDIKTKTAQ
jgi:nucleoredoxin